MSTIFIAFRGSRAWNNFVYSTYVSSQLSNQTFIHVTGHFNIDRNLALPPTLLGLNSFRINFHHTHGKERFDIYLCANQLSPLLWNDQRHWESLLLFNSRKLIHHNKRKPFWNLWGKQGCCNTTGWQQSKVSSILQKCCAGQKMYKFSFQEYFQYTFKKMGFTSLLIWTWMKIASE